MPKRARIRYADISRRQVNGKWWGEAGGGTNVTTEIGGTGQVVTNALLVMVDLVATNAPAVDGTVTTIDNVALAGGEKILRATPGGAVNDGLYIYGGGGAAWTRYRPELHVDGLVVMVTGGTSGTRAATAPNVPFSGFGDTQWTLITGGTITLGTTSIEFRQLPTHDGLKLQRTTTVALTVAPGLATIVPFTAIAHTNDCADLYMTPVMGVASQVTVKYSGLYYVDFSILCNHASATAMLGATVYIGGVAFQEIIRHTVTTTEERHHGGTLVRLAGDDLEALTIRLTDPGGAGYTITSLDCYMDLYLVARR